MSTAPIPNESSRWWGTLRLLAEVRWQIFRNSLRQSRKKWELAAQAGIIVVGGLIAIGFGIIVAGATYLSLTRGKPSGLALVLWAIFFMWQVGPLVLEGASPALDFREIARYPVPFSLYYLLSLAYGLLDQVALLSLTWLAFAWYGMALARPDLALPSAAVLSVFAVVNLFLNRVFFQFLQRLFARRRGREAAVAVMIVAIVLMNIIVYGVMPAMSKERVRSYMGPLAAVHEVSPPGLVASALVRQGSASVPVVLLAAYVLAAAVILRRQLRRIYQGESLSEAAPQAATVQVQPGWRLPGIDDRASAIFEKELRYAMRDSRTHLAFAMGPVAAIVAAMSFEAARRVLLEGLNIVPERLYIIVPAYALLNLSQLSYNSCCYDSYGFQRWLLAPVSMRQVLLVKNAVHALIVVLNVLLIWMVLALSGIAISGAQFAAAAAGLSFAGLSLFAAGNFFSAWFPARVEYGTMSAKKVSSVAVLMGMLSQAVVVGVLGLIVFVSNRYHLDLLPYVVFPLLFLLAFRLYLQSVDAASLRLLARSEEIAAALV